MIWMMRRKNRRQGEDYGLRQVRQRRLAAQNLETALGMEVEEEVEG